MAVSAKPQKKTSLKRSKLEKPFYLAPTSAFKIKSQKRKKVEFLEKRIIIDKDVLTEEAERRTGESKSSVGLNPGGIAK